MASTKIQINYQDPNGKDGSATISYVNPNATSAKLVEFAQKLMALTNNSYQITDKIVTTTLDLDTQEG